MQPPQLAEDVLPLGQLLLHSAQRWPEQEALVFPGERLTYRELTARAWALARALASLGVRPREHVGILMTNHPDLVASYFGVAMLGAVIVPLNARYRAAELAAVVEDSDIVALLTHDAADEHVDLAGLLHESLPDLSEATHARALALPRHPKLRAVAMLGKRTPAGMVLRDELDALAAECDEQELRCWCEDVCLRSPAMILYTSGTTSRPRGAILTHEAFVGIWMGAARIFQTTPEDRHYTALPLFHVAALGCLTWTLGCGATFFSDYSVDAGRTLATLERERITEFYPAYQPVMEAVLSHPRFDETDLGALRVFLNVAPPEVLARFQERIPHAVQLTTYGGTEGGALTLSRLDDPLEERIATCGRPQPGVEVRICDTEGRVLGHDQPGEIQFRGFNTLSGYHKSPQKNAETMLADGWVGLGDLGVIDAKGQLLFTGRLKETLKVGGENVAPQEIEQQLCVHPAVKLAQVVGIPDARLVEVPAAFVELLPGARCDEEQLIAHCRGRVASFKVPRLIRFLDESEWPMSTTKIQREKLRERLLEELGLDA